MSFRIWKKGEGEAGPPARDVSRALSGAAILPPDLVAASASRITTMALVAAATLSLFALLDRVFSGPHPGSSGVLWLIGVAGAIGASLVMAWIAGREMLDSEKLLDAALVYEVVMGFFLAVNIHSTPMAAGIPRGWSAVAVWALAYPLIVPATRGKVILATVATAAMDPVGLLAQVAAGNPPPHGPAVWFMFLPTAVAATVAIVVSGIVYKVNVEAERGHEMGSYHLEELLGSGGMGEVWKASHRLLARSAAIKLIRPDSSGSDGRESIKRFEREVQAAAGLQSPHTVDIYDFGTTEDGTFYYVMELLEGFDVETLVERFGPVPAERAVHILIQACHSLAEAHQGGLIHRDVKPANIYVCRYGLEWDFVKILDFGLVKNTGSEINERQLTLAGVLAGTPGYMAPEMGLETTDLDWRADIYALGAVGYWLVTGQTVFDPKRPPMQIIMDHVQKAPVPPSRRTSNAIPPRLEEILMACLQKDPNNRPQTMQELSAALRIVPLDREWTEERARRWWLAHAREAQGEGVAAKPTEDKASAPTAAVAG
ncbi:MAG: serine/threonine-protein kinase [Thermoanaerobaculia bacterium]